MASEVQTEAIVSSPTSPTPVTVPTSPAPVTAPASPAVKTAPAVKAQPPPGYRFVKVRKPDGTVVTVKKKLTPEELAAGSEAPLSPIAPEYELITVRKPDGTLAKVRRPIQKDAAPSASNVKATTSKTPSGPASPVVAAAPKKTEKAANVESKPKDALSVSPASPTSPTSPVPPMSPMSAVTATSTDPILGAPTERGMTEEEALQAQDAYFKETRRSRFKSALFQGMLRTAASTAIPELGEHDEIVSDSDLSVDDSDDDNGPDDDNGHDDDDNSNSHDHNDDSTGTNLNGFGTKAAANIATAAAATPLQAPRAPPAYQKSTPEAAAATNPKEKTSYKITTKDLKHLDEETAAKANDRPLYRHWAKLSFYLLASLSVVLPLCFLIMSIVIALTDGKPANSHWRHVHQAVVVAVSAWPIVFAAVVAQSFKTWATFRVERGIRLMQLEQLVGSNSFGSAMKQPFVLRRLDIMTLLIFVVWCLSPIGTQALQRVSSVQLGDANDAATVYYGNILGNNNLFSDTRWKIDDESRANLLQMTAVSYIANFMPYGLGQLNNPLEDQYNHPLISRAIGTETYMQTGFYGLPVALPPSTIQTQQENDQHSSKGSSTADANSNYKDSATVAAYEYYNFNATTSAWNFTCGQFTTHKRQDLTNLHWSLSETLGMNFTTIKSSETSGSKSNGLWGVNHLTFATLLRESMDRTNSTSNEPDWEYDVIECDFKQMFYIAGVSCYVNPATNFVSDCESIDDAVEIPDNAVQDSWRTKLMDFAEELVLFGVPFAYSNGNTTTQIETITENNAVMDQQYYTPNSTYLVGQGGDNFASGISFAFNTWIGIGYCPECIFVSASNDSRLNESYWTRVDDADHWYSTEERFAINKPWLVVLFFCSGLLLAVGVASIIIESRIVAPDVLGYVSSTVRNSKYLHLPKTTTGTMSGGERARQNGMVKVMMQDVKADAEVGKIALGLQHDKAARLRPGRVYR